MFIHNYSECFWCIQYSYLLW